MAETTTKDNSSTVNPTKAKSRCPSPEQIFAVSTGFAAFLSSNLSRTDIQTLINLLTLLTANLIGIVTQQEICEGIAVITEEDFIV